MCREDTTWLGPFSSRNSCCVTGLVWASSVSPPWAVHPQSDGKVPGAWNSRKSHLFFAKGQEKYEISEEHQLRRLQGHHSPAAATHRLWVSQGALSNMKNQGLCQQTFIFPPNQMVPPPFCSVQFTLVLWLRGWHLLSARSTFWKPAPSPCNLG